MFLIALTVNLSISIHILLWRHIKEDSEGAIRIR